MPLFRRITQDGFDLALWQISEPLAYFESLCVSPPKITNEPQRLQWYASRYLANVVAGKEMLIEKNEMGKPIIAGDSFRISISHTTQLAAVMLSTHAEVGVDVEMVNPRVERIASKFLLPSELAVLETGNRIEKLILYWSAKEALYKLHGRKGLDFKTQLLIEPFDLQKQGTLAAQIKADGMSDKTFKVAYEFLSGYVLTYVVGR